MGETTAIYVAIISLSASVVAAGIGLTGAFIGANISARSQQDIAERRDKLDAERDRREVLAAARVIEFELARARAAATICVEKRHWWSDDIQLSTDEWQKHKHAIAPILSLAEWSAVTIAIEAIDNLRSSARHPGPTDEISDSTAAGLVPMQRDIEKGWNALAPYIRDVPPTADETRDKR
jgi:hypothetical protein